MPNFLIHESHKGSSRSRISKLSIILTSYELPRTSSLSINKHTKNEITMKILTSTSERRNQNPKDEDDEALMTANTNDTWPRENYKLPYMIQN